MSSTSIPGPATGVGATPGRAQVDTQVNSSGKKTRGGSTLRGSASKANQTLDVIYPDSFKPTNRQTYKELAGVVPIRIHFTHWVQDPNKPTDADMANKKFMIDYRMRQVLFVYCSTKNIGRIVMDACPDVSNTTVTFQSLYSYAQRTSAGFKHRLLYQHMYKVARIWLQDFGMTNFRLDPRIWIDAWQCGEGFEHFDEEEHLEHTKKWIYDHLDKTVFNIAFKQWEKMLDWTTTFKDKKKKPFYYLKIMSATMVKEVAFVVVSEEMLNPGRTWRPDIVTGWKRDDNQRRICDRVFERFSALDNFKDIELRHFTWLPPKTKADELNEDLSSAPADLINRHIMGSNSPPPGSDTESDVPQDLPRRKTAQSPPRHKVQQTTADFDHTSSDISMTDDELRDLLGPVVEDGSTSTQKRKAVTISDNDDESDDNLSMHRTVGSDSNEDYPEQPLMKAAGIKYPTETRAQALDVPPHSGPVRQPLRTIGGGAPVGPGGLPRIAQSFMGRRPLASAAASVRFSTSKIPVPILGQTPSQSGSQTLSQFSAQKSGTKKVTRSQAQLTSGTETTSTAGSGPATDAAPASRTSGRARKKSMRALESEASTNIADTRGVTAGRSGTLASRGRGRKARPQAEHEKARDHSRNTPWLRRRSSHEHLSHHRSRSQSSAPPVMSVTDNYDADTSQTSDQNHDDGYVSPLEL